MNRPPRHPRHYEKLLPLTLCLVLGALVGCKTKEPPTVKKREPVNVKVMTVKPLASKADAFELHAKVEPNRISRVAAEVNGRIEEICCEEGARVTAGANSKPIIKLNTDLLAARLKQARAQSTIDSLDFARIQKFRATGISTESEFEHSREQANTSQAVLAEAQAMFDRAQIYPPIDGVLNNRPVEKGDYVQPGKIVAEIVDTDTVKIVAHVPERDIHFLKLGDTATIIYTYKRQPRTRDAKITFISKTAHKRSLTTKIEVKIDNSDGEFFSGQVVSLLLRRRILENVIMVPLDSVIPVPQEDGPSKYIAYIMVGDEFSGVTEKREGLKIDLSVMEGKNVRVIEGLKAGDRLIIEGHRIAGDKREVTLKKPDSDATSKPASNPASEPKTPSATQPKKGT